MVLLEDSVIFTPHRKKSMQKSGKSYKGFDMLIIVNSSGTMADMYNIPKFCASMTLFAGMVE